MDHVGNIQDCTALSTITFCPYHNVDRRPEMIWEFVQAEQDGCKAQHHLEKPVLMAGQVKEDADRLKKSGEEKREGSRATVTMQKDYNKIMLDLVKHQLTDKRNKPAS